MEDEFDELDGLSARLSSLVAHDGGAGAGSETPEAPREPRPFIVDALNLLNFFSGKSQTGQFRGKPQPGLSPWEQIAVMRTRVRGFLRACESSNLRPHFVVDAGWQSDEAFRKWLRRREREFATDSRFLPLGMDALLCDMLVEAGARVYRADGLDGDDVIVRMALEAGDASLILSADRDMFRYTDLSCAQQRVCAEFMLDGAGQHVYLLASPSGRPKDGVRSRKVTQLPYEPDTWLKPASKLHTAPQVGYVRGCCSPWTRRHGNLHGLARPLRLAVYAALGVQGRVREVYPDRCADSEAVRWVDEKVEPDGSLLPLLAQPHAALEWLTQADPCAAAGDDPVRAFARVSLVAELVNAIALRGVRGRGDLGSRAGAGAGAADARVGSAAEAATGARVPSMLEIVESLGQRREAQSQAEAMPKGLLRNALRWPPPQFVLRAPDCHRVMCGHAQLGDAAYFEGQPWMAGAAARAGAEPLCAPSYGQERGGQQQAEAQPSAAAGRGGRGRRKGRRARGGRGGRLTGSGDLEIL
jgi:hypothetical protein